MKQFVFSVYDKSAQVFGRPVFVRSQVEAMRSFESQVMEPARTDYANPLNSHPQDFALMHLGWFDDEAGKFENLEIPARVMEGSAIQARSVAAMQASLFDGGRNVSPEAQGR